MSPILYAIPFFLGFIALEVIVSRRMGRPVYRFHDAVTSLNIGFVSETIRAFAKLMSVVIYALLVDKVAAFTWDVRSPAVWVLAFFMYDFFYYWAHRCGHEVNLLWASHVVHHSSEDFNLSTALRQSWSNQFFYWIFYLPMAIVGIPLTVFVVIALLSAVYQFWSHTRLIPKLGWVDRVFVTPSNHRCHHGRNPYCIDKNYGGTLIIWDRFFGTWVEERDDEPVVYGTLTPLRSWSPLWGNVKNYAGIVQQVGEMRGWRNKLMVVFAPPGWTPGTQKYEPKTLGEHVLFETPVSQWQKVYGVIASCVILALVIDLMLATASLSVPVRMAYAGLIVCHTVTLALLFEGHRRAFAIEAIRCVLVFGALVAGVWFQPVPVSVRVGATVGLLVSLAALSFHYRERVGLQQHAPARTL